MFLKALNYTLYSYLDKSLTPSDRIYKSWYGLFFFRMWRSWLVKSQYTLKECFISSNTYLCIELNAHSLVKQLLKLGQIDDYKFMPDLQGSQPCETMFRQARAFSPMGSTVVNFNMMEFISRINKIQLQSDIIKTYSNHINFPRFEEKQKNSTLDQANSSIILTTNEIIIQIEKARSDISKDMTKFGIDIKDVDFGCQIKPVTFNDFNYDDIDDDDDDSSDDENTSYNEDYEEEADISENEEHRTLSGIIRRELP